MNFRPSALLIVGVALFAGCSHSAPRPPAAAFCMARVQSFSNPDAGARGDFSPNVRFADLALTSNSIGYGAAGQRSDEITIAGGVMHLARPAGDAGFGERTRFGAGEGGYMVQLISSASWRPAVALGPIANLDDLGVAIARAASAQGCTGDTKLAFRLTARVEHAEWSLDTLPRRGDFTADVQDATIVGLYATVDQQKHFVTQGRNIHAHVLFPALGVAGHLKSASFASGGQLVMQGS